MDLKEKLLKCDKNVCSFNLEGQVKICKVVDVYDGDTCKVVFETFGELYRWTIRMNGYDCPEMRPSKKLENRDEIKKNAIISRDFLKSKVMNENQLVYIKCGDFDKYGRLLGTIYINENDDKSINDLMIENKHGYEYHGGTKK